MNLKVRLKNPVFIIQLLLSIIMPVFAYFGLKGEDISTWKNLWCAFCESIKNPYIVLSVLTSVWNALTDPTTKGLRDSPEARCYTVPKGK